MKRLQFGLLGAAPIAVDAMIRPARHLPGLEIAAVAARDPERARRYARRHGIGKVPASYAALLADPAIDAVYIPLPNSLHAEWARRALDAGKHVLCEKPLAANATEAAALAAHAEASGLVLCEAMHYRYHPLAARLCAILASGEIGEVQHIEAEFSVPLLNPGSIQFRAELGGGAMMDVGCYAFDLIRLLVGAEPQVLRASAACVRPQVDRWAVADMAFADGRTARMQCALLSSRLLRLGARVQGSQGELRVLFPFLPHIFNRISVRTRGATRHEQIRGGTSYAYQLAAFANAVHTGAALPTNTTNALATQRLVDAAYRAAGLQPRG